MSEADYHPCADAVIDLLDIARYLPESLIQELAALRGNEHFSPGDEAKSKIRRICLRVLDFVEIIPDTLEVELYAYLEMLNSEEAQSSGEQ